MQKISRDLRTASDVVVGPMIRSKSRSVEVWISLTMPVPSTVVPECTAGASRCSWSSSRARLLGTRTISRSTRPGGSSRVVRRSAPAAGALRRRFASVACRPRKESVTRVGRVAPCAASAVVRAPQRSPRTTVAPGEAGPPVSARCWSAYASAASQARNCSRGSAGKRVRSRSPHGELNRCIVRPAYPGKGAGPGGVSRPRAPRCRHMPTPARLRPQVTLMSSRSAIELPPHGPHRAWSARCGRRAADRIRTGT